MKLTVDASVVVKWFIPELLASEARALLAPRFDLHAPDLLLAEFANTIWKKVRRNELANSQPYMEELSRLGEVVALHSGPALVMRAMQIATRIDHAVYDCLYLACAEATESALITADQRFANKVSGRFRTVNVYHVGSANFVNEIIQSEH